jgi:uncharacterized protein (TIGR00299 family) protein
VKVPKESKERNLADIVKIIRRARLGPDVTGRAIAIFKRLAAAEAKVHGVAKDKVHFHEVGGYDCIVDIVGAALGVDLLGLERITSSPVNLGNGTVTFSHGTFAVPAPATAELLKGAPVYQPQQETGELATPTGAAILRELVVEFGPMPAMRLAATGIGAGNVKSFGPNALRLFVGEDTSGDDHPDSERVTVIETNIDDMNPEMLGYVMEKLFAAGALDVYFTPIYMKKNRPATLLSVIGPPSLRENLTGVILTETTSLGVRYLEMNRTCLERETWRVPTRFGPIQIKVGKMAGRRRGVWPYGRTKVAPEYESCAAAARKHKVPLKVVYEEALKAGGMR